MDTVYLDTETTGLSAEDEIVEITIIDDNGEPLINTLLKPVNHTHWPDAERVHGISPIDIRHAPTQKQISDNRIDSQFFLLYFLGQASSSLW